MKKFITTLIIISVILSITIAARYITGNSAPTTISSSAEEKNLQIKPRPTPLNLGNLPKLKIVSDKNNNGIPDPDDMVEGARKDVQNHPNYISTYYYNQGYPPDNEGVCSDVIWRAFKNAGYMLKDMIDKDIKEHQDDYTGLTGGRDPDIDFRRVVNLNTFFKKYATSLTTELIPYDEANLIQWQRGDIVVFNNDDHIAIISDKRSPTGVPFIIHNPKPTTIEADQLGQLQPRIVAHYRYPKQ
jgi:uncharacterized protein